MNTARQRPWYMSVVLTGSGWFSALLLVLAVALLLDALELLKEGLGPLIIGVLALPPLFLLDQRAKGPFIEEIIPPLMIGMALSILFGTSAFFTAPAAAITAWTLVFVFTLYGRRTVTVFTLTFTAWLFSFNAIGNDVSRQFNEILLAGLLTSSAIFSIFPNTYFRATDHSLPTLLAACFVLAFDVFDFGVTDQTALLKGLGAALLLAGLWLLNNKQITTKLILMALFLVITLIAMPPAILGAFFLLFLGWVRGDKAYCGIGILLSAATLFQFYTSLDLTLLQRSLQMSVTGLVFLSCFWALKR